jgi:hypothetical protein
MNQNKTHFNVSRYRKSGILERLKRTWARWRGTGREVISLKERIRMTLAATMPRPTRCTRRSGTTAMGGAGDEEGEEKVRAS